MLAQWGVLVVIFSQVVHLNVADYPLFVLSGMLTWSWFATGVSAGTNSLVSKRHLVFQPRLQNLLLPTVSVAVAFLDVLIALPIVVLVVLVTGRLHWTILFLPVLVAVQFVLMSAVVSLTAAATVYLRDTRSITEVGLIVLFYLTPVFYSLSKLHSTAKEILYFNPMTTMVDGWRNILIDGRLPNLTRFGLVTAASLALAAVAVPVFHRLERGFVDEL